MAVGATYLDQRTLVVVLGGLASAAFADIEPAGAEPLVATPQVEGLPRLSADGNWIIYMAFARRKIRTPRHRPS